jgi:2-aminoethylphosphonate transport system permease protein
MLFHSKAALRWSWAVFALLAALFFGLPLVILVVASLARQWNGVYASRLGFSNLLEALSGHRGMALLTSLATASVATLCSTALGTWGALASRNMSGWFRSIMDAVYIMPITLPSVTVGLAVLVTFSRPPLLLNGTPYLVIMSHVILITAYTYNCIRAGLARLPEAYEQVAASLGGSRAYILLRVTLPMLRPYIAAAASLSFAYSMGELGATIMVYPPGWVTAPVDICALTDRGSIFTGAAMSVLLLGATVFALVILNRLGRRGSRHGAPY